VTAPEPGGVAAALMQIAALTEELRKVDGREADHWVKVRERLRELTSQLASLSEGLGAAGELAAGAQASVQELTGRVEALEDPEEPAVRGYVPIPATRWFTLQGDERAEAIARIRSWVETVFRPGMGRPAGRLPECWAEHEFCLYQLDVLSELWSVLWLQPKRTAPMLSGQAEWLTRLLPAFAEMLAAEAAGCEHARAGARR
jgi:hypothetical protein